MPAGSNTTVLLERPVPGPVRGSSEFPPASPVTPVARRGDSELGSRSERWWRHPAIPCALLAVLLVANLPIVVCRPLGPDPVLYDLQARVLLEGGTLYRDIIEPNLPGVVAVHALVRSVAGWSPLALRVADLLIVGSVIWLLSAWVQRLRKLEGLAVEHDSRAGPVWLAVVLTWFYLSLTESQTCQRDLWTLLPVLTAMTLRWYRVHTSFGEHLPRGRFVWGAVIEGVLWAIACWIKPQVVIPGGLVVLVSTLIHRRRSPALLDIGSVLLGGGLFTASVIDWMVHSGTWPHFVEMMTEWNPQYFQHGRRLWSVEKLLSSYRFFSPLSLGVPVALLLTAPTLASGLRKRKPCPSAEADVLLVTLFIGWTLQAVLLQNTFAYVQLPVVVLAVTTLWRLLPRFPRLGTLVIPAAIAAVLMAMPGRAATNRDQLAAWPACLREGPTTAVQQRVQLDHYPDRGELATVTNYLRTLDLRDGDLTTFNLNLVHMYAELRLRPSTRYVFTDILAHIFRDRAGVIEDALQTSGQRFVVSSLTENGLAADVVAALDDDPAAFEPLLTAETLGEFPYNQTVIHRTGQYVVHRVDQPVGRLCLGIRKSTGN
ncbi:MAG: hypothetical protein R3B90_15085 [Planctomycetaceae bacterium]